MSTPGGHSYGLAYVMCRAWGSVFLDPQMRRKGRKKENREKMHCKGVKIKQKKGFDARKGEIFWKKGWNFVKNAL